MEGTTSKHPLNSSQLLPRRFFNRAFALIYSFAILTLFYHHAKTLIHSPFNLQTFFISLPILVSDLILTFTWLNSQCFRMNPVIKTPFPENLAKVFTTEEFPALDIFICTADPYKEPPMTVAATALSVMAYDYPAEKLSIYVSDDGGSQLTLFALMEAARFAKAWLPFCKENKIMERSPDAFFAKTCASHSDTRNIQMMYEDMKSRVEKVVERGFVEDEHKISGEAFGKWTQGFTTKDHPTVVQVVSESGDDKDLAGSSMPNLIYVSRQKNRAVPHHFKAGALNVLLRVSAIMTNAPILLTLDCDMISNDPTTPQTMLCFFMDHSIKSRLGYVQFPLRLDGINNADIYGSELRRMFHINPVGLNGLLGPDYFGTGTFFSRRAFHGGPSSFIEPEMAELGPDYIRRERINSPHILELAHRVAGRSHENGTNWGSKIGFRYGSLVEDFYTGYRLHCEGWRSIFCNPERPAFLADNPISLNDMITQQKRWAVGLFEVAFSKYSPLTFGTRFLGPLMTHCYCYYAFGPMMSFPITIYAFLPQLTLLNNISIFPKVSDPWFFLYVFLFVGSFGQDCLEFISTKSTLLRWLNDQRMGLTRALSSDVFGTLEYISNQLGIGTRDFGVTSKVNGDGQRKRYDEGKIEYGVASPLFVPFSSAAILNLVAFIYGVLRIASLRKIDEFLGQVLVTSFGVLICLPIYEAMFLRNDEGRMPIKITVAAIFLASVVFVAFSVVAKL
ncbi:LOW QUALITY PROTEIN: cellulose synthase-like protein G3 [Primulina eburnea]|uniref:LOW QUALITY PROTEIN: cellulose synthase-like protein G3 n=1 Tax=Primulina eburnea TaxID=1245227 RepID=UPI003C6C58B5